MTESLEDRIRRLMDDSCMTPTEAEQAKQRLQAYFDAHPDEAQALQTRMELDDKWNFPDQP